MPDTAHQSNSTLLPGGGKWGSSGRIDLRRNLSGICFSEYYYIFPSIFNFHVDFRFSKFSVYAFIIIYSHSFQLPILYISDNNTYNYISQKKKLNYFCDIITFKWHWNIVISFKIKAYCLLLDSPMWYGPQPRTMIPLSSNSKSCSWWLNKWTKSLTLSLKQNLFCCKKKHKFFLLWQDLHENLFSF